MRRAKPVTDLFAKEVHLLYYGSLRGIPCRHERQLLREVWGPDHVDRPHYLRVYMRQLRGKIEADPMQPRYLLTEIGVGSRLLQSD